MSCGSECLTEPQVPSSSTEYHSRTWETSITGLAGRNHPGSWRKRSVLSQLHSPHVFCTLRTLFLPPSLIPFPTAQKKGHTPDCLQPVSTQNSSKNYYTGQLSPVWPLYRCYLSY